MLINPKPLMAMAGFAGRDEFRPAISGVCVEYHDDTPTGLVATDGRCLGYLKLGDYRDGFRSALIPLDIIPHIPQGLDVDLTFGDMITIKGQDWTIVCAPTTQQFPKWREVLPEGPLRETKTTCIKPSLLQKFQEFGDHFGSAGVRLNFRSPTDPIEVEVLGVGEFRGLLMPIRDP